MWGETRAEAILRMRRALEEYRIIGVRTNIPFHQNLMDSHRFMGGQFDTRFVEERFSFDGAEIEQARLKATSLQSSPPWLPTAQPNALPTSSSAASAIPATGNGWVAGSGCTARGCRICDM